MSPVAKVCAGAVLAAAALLFLVLDLPHAHWRVPFYYDGDSLPILALCKGIAEGNWLYHNPRLAAPFGADWRDYPVAMSVDAAGLKLLGFFTTEAGTLANVYWLLSILFSAAAASYCLLRFGVPGWIAASFGAIYALQPAAFFRNEQHLNLAFYHSPLIATAAIELILGRIRSWREIPKYAWLGVLLQGFSYIYFAFFAGFFLCVAGVIGWLIRRDRQEALAAGVLLSALIAACAINHSPSALFWLREGRGPAVTFKFPGEADAYGLKLRHMLTPIQHHPIYPLRRISETLDNAHFPLENENTTARLGSVQAIGLLLLAASLLLAPMGKRVFPEAYLGPASVLFLCGFLLATIGGFGSIFNTFVSPDIRSYNRVSFYLSFFCLLASAAIAAKAWQWTTRAEWSPFIQRLAIVVFLLIAAGDQAETALLTRYDASEKIFSEERTLVGQLEAQLPPRSRVLELPNRPFPNDPGQGEMRPFDHVRPYLHSKSLRWTWGAMPGRNGEWQARVLALAPKPLVREACASGFQAIWLDEAAYPQNQSPRAAFAAMGLPELISGLGGRIHALDLRPACKGLFPESHPDAPSDLSPIVPRFEDGFFGQEADAEHVWHWSGQTSVLGLRNLESVTRHVRLSWLGQNSSATPLPLTVQTPQGERQFPLTNTLSQNTLDVQIPPEGSVQLRFRTQSPRVVAPADPRELYFAVYDFTVMDAPQ